MLYQSTRNNEEKVSASEAVLRGISRDGGLYVPEEIPVLDVPFETLKGMSYQEIAYEVMKLFLSDYTEEELKECIDKAYDDKFDTKEIAPLVKAGDNYYLELFHGPTIAFKDMALSILPYLMTTAAKKQHIKNDIVILTATSGDTGKAALAGFADVKGTKIIVFYPKDGVSEVQKLQMVTQKGENTSVVAIHGNFDNAQTGVKQLLADKELEVKMNEAGYQFSSANSINIGRLVPQIVYYVYTYAKLLQKKEIAEGEKINVVVPTGNFGNILAAYLAKKIGTPIGRLICASNENKVLYDFFGTGVYDKNREFILTSSPSMDILISSNLERLVYLASGRDDKATKRWMEELKEEGRYTLPESVREEFADFTAGYATEEQVAGTIKELYEDTGYVIDTHTAVAAFAAEQYKKDSGDTSKTVIASTASPYKFMKSVMTAINPEYENSEDLELANDLSKVSKTKIPEAVREIMSASIRHTRECEVDEMKDCVEKILGI